MRRYFELATAALAVIIGLGAFTVGPRAQYLITGMTRSSWMTKLERWN